MNAFRLRARFRHRDASARAMRGWPRGEATAQEERNGEEQREEGERKGEEQKVEGDREEGGRKREIV